MIDFENYEYELDYNFYLAEKEYYSDLDRIMYNMVVNEETTLGYVNESLQDAVKHYITKVIASTQNVWDKFKASIDRGKDMAYLKKIRPSILKFNEKSDFFINNYPEHDLTALVNLNIIPLNYNQMKENLRSRETFMTAYYKNINFQNKVSVKKAVKDYLTRNVHVKFKVSKPFLIEKFNFNSKKYYELKVGMETDMETLNKCNDSIVKLSGSILPTEESINFRNVYESILLESPINNMINGNKTNGVKMSFSDASGKKLNPNKKVTSDKYLKRINVYMDCMAGIVTGKMTILNEEYKNNMNILTMVHNRSGGGTIITDRQGQPKTNVEL